jgi:xanthine dehydrogenase iron-sulfur cluster and FAD-binding subunit A
MATDCIRFILDGRDIAVAEVAPTTTLLDWLRNDAGLTATREGCAEGDCGSCTVVAAEPDGDGRLRWRPLNACLQLLPMLHGRALYTIAALRSPQGELHPVQHALRAHHASQCGFCTPGFAMALFALCAAVTLSDAFAVLLRHYPEAAPTLRRFGSRPIRNAGTLCGNLAHASPVGDAIPLLIALDARLQLRHAGQVREIALQDFYLRGRRCALQPGELVQAVRIPLRPGTGFHFRAWKVSKRHDQDIATLSASFALQIEQGVVRSARLAYGGLAERPQRADRPKPRCWTVRSMPRRWPTPGARSPATSSP